VSRQPIDVRLDAAIGLLENYARTLPYALAHIDRELHIIDGWSDSTMSDGMPRGESPLTAVERHAEARLRLSGTRAQLIDDRDAILSLIASALHVCRDAAGMRSPANVARCKDAQTGRDGLIEWGDPTCEEIPSKAGLCSACYQRERRYRLANGKAPREFEPIA
jgi:hypothetical protein